MKLKVRRWIEYMRSKWFIEHENSYFILAVSVLI